MFLAKENHETNKKKNSQWCSIRDPIVLINNKIPDIYPSNNDFYLIRTIVSERKTIFHHYRVIVPPPPRSTVSAVLSLIYIFAGPRTENVAAEGAAGVK